MWNGFPAKLWSRLAILAAVALAYFAAAKLSMAGMAVHGSLSAIWPAAGVAMTAMVLWGLGLWPAVIVGSSVAGLDTGYPWLVAAGIATGNTLAACGGALILRRRHICGEFRGVGDVVAMMVAAAVAPLIAATAGVFCLSSGRFAAWPDAPALWSEWWVGDALGTLLTVPLGLAWLGRRLRPPLPTRGVELLICLSMVVVAATLVFAGESLWERAKLGGILVTPLLLPPLLWAALRLHPRGLTLCLAVMAALAIVYTVIGQGPYDHHDGNIALLRLELILASISCNLLMVGGATVERDKASAEAITAKERAEAASTAKSRFIAAVRHDMSQPLQAARLFLAMTDPWPDEPRGRAVMERLGGSMEALAGILDALGDIAAVECDLVHPKRAVFPIGPVLNQLKDEYSVQAAAKGLSFRAVPSSVQVDTDPHLLGRILRNLLSNALRYTRRGRILVGCRRDRRGLRIEIWDTGPGIPTSEQEVIFEAFRRLDTAKHPEGVGLGLATVRRLAAILGLAVGVHSTVGKGSCFSVVVPMPAPAQRQSAA